MGGITGGTTRKPGLHHRKVAHALDRKSLLKHHSEQVRTSKQSKHVCYCVLQTCSLTLSAVLACLKFAPGRRSHLLKGVLLDEFLLLIFSTVSLSKLVQACDGEIMGNLPPKPFLLPVGDAVSWMDNTRDS